MEQSLDFPPKLRIDPQEFYFDLYHKTRKDNRERNEDFQRLLLMNLGLGSDEKPLFTDPSEVHIDSLAQKPNAPTREEYRRSRPCQWTYIDGEARQRLVYRTLHESEDDVSDNGNWWLKRYAREIKSYGTRAALPIRIHGSGGSFVDAMSLANYLEEKGRYNIQVVGSNPVELTAVANDLEYRNALWVLREGFASGALLIVFSTSGKSEIQTQGWQPEMIAFFGPEHRTRIGRKLFSRDSGPFIPLFHPGDEFSTTHMIQELHAATIVRLTEALKEGGKYDWNSDFIPLMRKAVVDLSRYATSEIEGKPVHRHLVNAASRARNILLATGDTWGHLFAQELQAEIHGSYPRSEEEKEDFPTTPHVRTIDSMRPEDVTRRTIMQMTTSADIDLEECRLVLFGLDDKVSEGLMATVTAAKKAGIPTLPILGPAYNGAVEDVSVIPGDPRIARIIARAVGVHELAILKKFWFS